MRTIGHSDRIRIAIIGGGSVVFCQTLIRDILAGATNAVDFTLMAPTTVRTSVMAAWAESLIRTEGLPATVSVVTDQREAVRHAAMSSPPSTWAFNVGGLRATECDYAISMRHGVDQCVGDTLGPGGILRAQRAMPG